MDEKFDQSKRFCKNQIYTRYKNSPSEILNSGFFFKKIRIEKSSSTPGFFLRAPGLFPFLFFLTNK